MDNLNEFLTRVASVQGSLYHRPSDPVVATGYRALIAALTAQFQLLRAFVDVSFVDIDPYDSSAMMFTDIDCNRRLSVYRIAALPQDHPLAALHANGETYNSIFRAVHDGLAHYPGRNPFNFTGEFRAFQAHAALIGHSNTLALQALACETLGQNAWYNFGPNARVTDPKLRAFAPQVAALIPRGTLADALSFPDSRYARCA